MYGVSSDVRPGCVMSLLYFRLPQVSVFFNGVMTFSVFLCGFVSLVFYAMLMWCIVCVGRVLIFFLCCCRVIVCVCSLVVYVLACCCAWCCVYAHMRVIV